MLGKIFSKPSTDFIFDSSFDFAREAVFRRAAVVVVVVVVVVIFIRLRV